MSALAWNFVIALAAILIGFLAKVFLSQYQEIKRTSGQSALLSGFEGPTKFVFPPRTRLDPRHVAPPPLLLPVVSIEDFLAINNLISAFLLSGREPPSKIVDSATISSQEKSHNNLILICSSKTNLVTKEALDLLRSQNPRIAHLIPVFETNPATGRTEINWNGATFPSESYDQEGPEFNDMAVILKAQNPWAAQHKILLVAGIRGIGTWGAAECLKKWWKPLYEKKDASKANGTSKQGNFVALLRVTYRDYDIKRDEDQRIQLEDLDRKR